MGKYTYSPGEEKILKVMKINQEDSLKLLHDSSSKRCDARIAESEKLLQSLGYDISQIPRSSGITEKSKTKIEIIDFEELAKEAEKRYDYVELEDLLTEDELNVAYRDLERIHSEFSRKTSIINKTDLSFLAIATALQVAKALITPIIAEKFDYGKSFDESKRLDHNDKTIEKEHRDANNEFKEKHSDHKNGKWQNILFQTVPYDITVGSNDINFNMEGRYHRLHTLGHDPILGWIFGTANILTDVITLNDMRSFKVERKPKMRITPQRVPTHRMFQEAVGVIKEDSLNLPAALFAQYRHLKSDEFTKLGLPVPLLEIFAPEFAGELYKSQYDALCLGRDLKIVGVSALVSIVFNMIISLIHGLFYKNDIDRKLYEVRTRKILLISNSIASTSSIINGVITQNPKNLDIGGLIVTVGHLFSDVRFMAKIKKEFIQNEIDKKLQSELAEIDNILSEYC